MCVSTFTVSLASVLVVRVQGHSQFSVSVRHVCVQGHSQLSVSVSHVCVQGRSQH